jgi:flagellar hook-associated protein 2
VASDPEAIAAQVAALVEAVNGVRSDIRAVTGFNLETKNKGKLYGDATVRGLGDRLASAVVGNGTSVAGVSLTREGTVAFDKEKFLKALAADPAAVQEALGSGLAGRLREVSHGASRSNSAAEGPGLLQTSITNRERQVSSLRSNITDWDQRLKLRQTTLQREFANLEKALGASQRQGQWLAGQIAGLPRMGS